MYKESDLPCYLEIADIEASPYRLPWRHSKRVSEGVLLRFRFDGGWIGYSCLQSWPQLGEPDLSSLLEQLRKRDLSHRLLEAAYRTALWDAFFRARKESATSRIAKAAANHYLIPRWTKKGAQQIPALIDQGYRTFKLKLGFAHDDEWSAWRDFDWRGAGCRFRFDFNDRLPSQEVLQYLLKLQGEFPESPSFIDYVEDPGPFCKKTWRKIHNQTRCSLAMDYEGVAWDWNKASPDLTDLINVWVDKPMVTSEAYRSFYSGLENTRIVYTSNLDHPLGQSAALFCAALWHPSFADETHGLLSLPVFESNSYFEQIIARGPYFMGVEGTGFGFDSLLEKETWKPL